MDDQCATCPHGWHGLPCIGAIYPNPANPYSSTPCNCPGPWPDPKVDA